MLAILGTFVLAIIAIWMVIELWPLIAAALGLAFFILLAVGGIILASVLIESLIGTIVLALAIIATLGIMVWGRVNEQGGWAMFLRRRRILSMPTRTAEQTADRMRLLNQIDEELKMASLESERIARIINRSEIISELDKKLPSFVPNRKIKFSESDEVVLQIDGVKIARISTTSYGYFIQSPNKIQYPTYSDEYKKNLRYYTHSESNAIDAAKHVISMIKYQIEKNPNLFPHSS